MTVSEDTTLVAGGFSESYIKVWNLKGKKLKSKSEREEGLAGTQYKKMIGHAGPVYGLSFSHDNKYLISCSEDQTGKKKDFCIYGYRRVNVNLIISSIMES